MQKLWLSLCGGQNQGVGGRGGGAGAGGAGAGGILGNVYKWAQHTDGCL